MTGKKKVSIQWRIPATNGTDFTDWKLGEGGDIYSHSDG
jgi:hypothetical protein